MDYDDQLREAKARIEHRAAELMVQHPDAPLNACISAAIFEEAFLYGCPTYTQPVGLIGKSPLQSLAEERAPRTSIKTGLP